MPNWVYNTLTVSGDPDELKKFADKARQQHETRWLSEQWTWNEEVKANTKIEDKDRKILSVMSDESPISFWNFIAPPTESLEDYFGTAGFVEGVGFTGDKNDESAGWYAWNSSNWGTKWDVSDESVSTKFDEMDDTTTELRYYFSTAWSIPTPVFEAMVVQHPELDFHLHSTEEQGWGAEFSGSGGSYSMDKEWDIPQSHADYVDTDQEDSCVCQNDDDEDNWYEDCPRDDKAFIVVIQKSYRVMTDTAENAYELAMEQGNNPDEQMEVLDETTAWVLDDQGVRQYPTLNSEVPKLE
jgi:hypothetical protein